MKLNRTAQRTIQILSYVSEHPSGVDLDHICEALRLPKTSAYDIVTTLVECNMLQIIYGQKNQYRLAMGIYQIGMGYRNNINYTKAFEEPLRSLAFELHKTAFFAVANQTNVVYLIKYEPEHPVLTTGKIGGINPMYCTALGKAILSQMPVEKQKELISQMQLTRRTDFTITDPQSLLADLEKCRQRGYAVDYRELEDHGLCVAAPVLDDDNSIVGAISVSDLYRPDEDYHAVGERVKQVASSLSTLYGHNGSN